MRSKLIQNSFDAEPIQVEHAEGIWLYDSAGKRYIDGTAGAVVMNIGHGRPEVVEAIARQAGKVAFTHRAIFGSAATEQLAERLGDMTGYAGVWFVNSGSEAVEATMQFALQYFRETGRPERCWFLSHSSGYHGNTLGALSLSGHGRRSAANGLALNFPVLPTPHGAEDDPHAEDGTRTERLLAAARKQFEAYADNLAAIVVEPVGGATLGATVPPEGYLAGLKALCDEFGALMIVDEVMTGMGRTGHVLAVDHWGVRPDLVALGKGLGAGYTPIAAALVNAKVLDAIASGSRRVLGGHTYGANPLSIATTTAVLDVMESDDLIAAVPLKATLLHEGLKALAEAHPFVSDVRGLGMLQAMEFTPAPAGHPGRSISQDVLRAAMDHGLALFPTSGGYNDAVVVAPPLTITPDEITVLVKALGSALTAVESALAGTSDASG
jgi:adenosylmethionine-8-amino-7-oxononanoate aminotransferase